MSEIIVSIYDHVLVQVTSRLIFQYRGLVTRVASSDARVAVLSNDDKGMPFVCCIQDKLVWLKAMHPSYEGADASFVKYSDPDLSTSSEYIIEVLPPLSCDTVRKIKNLEY